MPEIIQYIIKISISLAAIYLVYKVLLSRLTFYQGNRWYLLGYSVACFFLPFLNIYGWMDLNPKTQLFNLVPAMHSWVSKEQAPVKIWTAYDVLLPVLAAGVCFMVVRLMVQFYSLRRMHKRARLLTQEGIRLYEVDHPIIPFSFGMSVFIHPAQHDEDELKEIIRHEMVHVQEHHTVDIIFTEILVALNWFNPFAWLLRQSIRQNLEFIADRQVLAHGLDRKQYQHLLLKVIGQQQFSIASHLNFSALKKRIIMMNKIKSARVHLIKFLFALPIIAVLLLAFRHEQTMVLTVQVQKQAVPDTVAPVIVRGQVPLNSKGYYLTIADNQGECIVIIKDKSKKLVKAIALTDWNNDEKAMEGMYGRIPPPPPPPASPLAPVALDGQPIAPLPPISPLEPKVVKGYRTVPDAVAPLPPIAPIAPIAPKLAASITSMSIVNDKITLQLKNGKTEKYDLSDPRQKADFEKKYGQLPVHPEKVDIEEVEEIPTPNASIETDNEHITLRASRIELDTEKNIEGVIASENPPIYFIDGKSATAAGVKGLNPDNISQIDVYKGKEAIAKYGEKGKNGVINITLKKSK